MAKMSKKQMELKYGIKIDDDSWFSVRHDSYVMGYKIYSADGCLWEKGLKNLNAVQAECEEWAHQLLAIKEKVMHSMI